MNPEELAGIDTISLRFIHMTSAEKYTRRPITKPILAASVNQLIISTINS